MAVEPYDPGKAIGPDHRSYQQYLDERRLLIESERAAGDNFDKVLLALSAGSIALSVTFVEKIGSAGVAKPLLYGAWLVLASALVVNLRSFMALQESIMRVMQINDIMWESGPCDISNPHQPQIRVLNRWSFRLFVVGILLLLMFAGVNYQVSNPDKGTTLMNDESKITGSSQGEVKKSAGGPSVVKLPPPPPPQKGDTSGSGSGTASGNSNK